MSEMNNPGRKSRTDVVARTAPPYVHPNAERRKSTQSSAQAGPPPAKEPRPPTPKTVAGSNHCQPDADEDEDDTFGMVLTREEADALAECPDEFEAEDEPDFATSGLITGLKFGHCVRVPTSLGDVCRDGTEMLVLAQLIYWFDVGRNGKIRTSTKRKGYYWVAKTYAQLAADTGLADRQVRHAVSKLVRRRVLVKRGGLFQGLRTNFLRISTAALENVMPAGEAATDPNGSE